MTAKLNLEKIFKDNYKGNEASLQASLFALKQSGYTQMQTVMLLIRELAISLKEADSIVLNSKAWEKEKKDTLRLRNDFEEGLSQL